MANTQDKQKLEAAEEYSASSLKLRFHPLS